MATRKEVTELRDKVHQKYLEAKEAQRQAAALEDELKAKIKEEHEDG